MTSPLDDRNCPLQLLSRNENKILPHQSSLAELDEDVRRYLTLSEKERYTARTEIFFKLTPFLLKSLSWYCHISAGCGVNCQVSDLLSTAYIVFAELLDRFDFDRQLNFLGYVVNGLSWGIFNSFVKQRTYIQHRILSAHEASEVSVDKSNINEERLISAIELERLLKKLTTAERNLFLMHHLFGYSFADLAELQAKKAKTIQKFVERARRKLMDA